PAAAMPGAPSARRPRDARGSLCPPAGRGVHWGGRNPPLRSPATGMDAEPRKPAGTTGRRASKAGRRSHGFTVLEDIGALTARSEDLQETLQRVVEVVAERASTDVCSLYILDPRAQRLTLWATTGLERSPVGKVT